MVLAIDLSHLRATVPSVDELEHEIFNGHNTRWIHNPFFYRRVQRMGEGQD